MSATLMVAVPLALLGMVALLGFAGCGYPDFQFGPAFTDYSNSTVLSNVQCQAYWPLSEDAKTKPAHDLSVNHNDGAYIDSSIDPSLYPWPADMANQSADAGNGSLTLPAPGILVGDQVNGVQTTCMVVNGAFVRVENKSVFNPVQFTLEAWVRVDWTSGDAKAIRMVVDSRDSGATGGTGFAIGAFPDPDGTYHWTAIVGNGGTQPTPFTLVKDSDAIILNDPANEQRQKPIYLAMTFDGSGNLTLFVDGMNKNSQPVSYTQNSTQPLLIGAGGAFAGFRDKGGIGPLWPFVGAIQDVAVYNSALLSGDIQLHDANGRGNLSAG